MANHRDTEFNSIWRHLGEMSPARPAAWLVTCDKTARYLNVVAFELAAHTGAFTAPPRACNRPFLARAADQRCSADQWRQGSLLQTAHLPSLLLKELVPCK